MFLIRIYRGCPRSAFFLRCRFVPSCSLYAEQCLVNFSLFRAISLVFLRIVKCTPFSAVAIDEVPQ